MLAAALLLLGLSWPAYGAPAPVAPRFVDMTEPEIAKALREIHRTHPGLDERILAVSEAFLGVPYRLGPLGEGGDGEFNRQPLYSFRDLDCTTYV